MSTTAQPPVGAASDTGDRAHLMSDYVDACVVDLRRRFGSGAFPATTSVFSN